MAGVRILVATLEPWGTYHSAFAVGELAARGAHVAHLVPFTVEGPQVGQSSSIASGLDALLGADVLVVNALTAGSWPARAAARAVRLGVPVVFSHLAYLGPATGRAVDVPLSAVTAPSLSDARDTARHLGVDVSRVEVVGLPALDAAPVWCPVPSRALLVTTVSSPVHDPVVLKGVGSTLVAAGWDVVVAAHPREDRSIWSSWNLSSLSTLEAAASCQVAVGLPGTVFAQLAALGVPLVAVRDALLEREVPASVWALASYLDAPARLLDLVVSARPAAADLVEFTSGPRGGATARLADVWMSASVRLLPV